MLTDEQRQNRRDSWGVYRYVPLRPSKEQPYTNNQLAFHKSLAKIRVIIAPNRAGKTVAAVHEPAGLLAGGDGGDYPDWWGWSPDFTPKSPLTIWLASPKLPDLPIGDARLKRMFIGFWFTDPMTGERKWMPPLIPLSHLKKPDCINQKGVTTIETVNRDIIVMKSSHQAASSSAGEEPDLILVDEKNDPLVMNEFIARVAQDPSKRMIVSLTDDAENNETEYVDNLRRGVKSGLVEFFEWTSENPHIDQEHHDAVLQLLSREQYRVRKGGERLGEVRRCYPFANEWHEGFKTNKDPVRLNPYGGHGNWIPPSAWPKITDKWTRYVVHDPGETNPAACAWIAAEPGLNNLFVYRGLYWPEPYANFRDTIQEIFDNCFDEQFRVFMMDPKYGKRHMQFGMDAPRERRRIDLYNKESSAILGRPFRWAMAPSGIEKLRRSTRISSLKAYLNPDHKSVPMMWFIDDGSPGMEALKNEFVLYRWAAAAKGRTANPDTPVKKHDNFIYCVEVAAAMSFQWFPPDGEEYSVLRTPRNQSDPDNKLRDFMEGPYPDGYGETRFL
jgi:hypothetical protein